MVVRANATQVWGTATAYINNYSAVYLVQLGSDREVLALKDTVFKPTHL